MTGSCLCGAVRVSVPDAPPFIHDCNCTLCRKTGAAWGYYPSAAVAADGATVARLRTDKPDAAAEVHHCPGCGATTHFLLSRAFRAANPGADVAGVNMRLFDPALIAGVEVRFPDGFGWSGSGDFDYRRPPAAVRETW